MDEARDTVTLRGVDQAAIDIEEVDMTGTSERKSKETRDFRRVGLWLLALVKPRK